MPVNRRMGPESAATRSVPMDATANHNEQARREAVEFGERLRSLEAEKLTERMARPADAAGAGPLGIAMAITYIGYLLGFETTLGLRGGHKDVRLLVESWLRQLEPVRARAKAISAQPVRAACALNERRHRP